MATCYAGLNERVRPTADVRKTFFVKSYQDHILVNRTQVIERLKLGRDVEVELQNDGTGVRTFVEVRPVVDGCRATVETGDAGIEARLLRRSPNEDVIQEYRIRRCSLRPGWEAYENDWDHFLIEEVWSTCKSIDELEAALVEQFDINLEQLSPPGSTSSPL